MDQHPSTEKIQKLMTRLLGAIPDKEMHQLQVQYDELEARTTAEEMNKMERLLHTVISTENIRKTLAKPDVMTRLMRAIPDKEMHQLQAQYDELEARTTAEEMNKMERLLHTVISTENIRKSLGK
jgi:heme oxygenase